MVPALVICFPAVLLDEALGADGWLGGTGGGREEVAAFDEAAAFGPAAPDAEADVFVRGCWEEDLIDETCGCGPASLKDESAALSTSATTTETVYYDTK